MPAPPPEIEYAYPDQSVWTTRLDSHGDPDNPLLRLAAILFGRAGLSWHGKAYPAARMFEYLRDGTAPFSMLVAAPVLGQCCLLSKAPVAVAELRIYRKADHPPIRSRADLAGTSVATIRGYSYASLADFLGDRGNRVTNLVAVKHEAAFAMLQRGWAEYVIDYSGPAEEVLATQPIADVRYDILSRQDVYLVLSKGYPDAPQVMARLEAVAATLDVPAILAGPDP